MSIAQKTEPFLLGAAAGAAALAIIGFSVGGWVTGGTAAERIRAGEQQAVVASLAPICVAQFRSDPKAKASLAALKDTDSWKQAGYVGEAGWATMPGSKDTPNRDVAQACANVILKLSL